MEQGTRAINEMSRISKQMTDTMRELLEELAKLQFRHSSDERDIQVKKVLSSFKKEDVITRIEIDKELYAKYKNVLEKDNIPYVPFQFKHQEGKSNRDDMMLIFVRPQDLEKSEIWLRTVEEMKRLECQKDYRLFMQHNLYEYMMRIPVSSDPAWEQRFHTNAASLGLEYAFKENSDGGKELYVSKMNKETVSKAIFMTEWDLTGKGSDLIRKIALNKVEQTRSEIERLGSIAQKGSVYICKTGSIGERLLVESGRFVHYDKYGMEVASMDRMESPSVYDFKLNKIMDEFMQSRHVLIDAQKLDEIIKNDPHSQPDYLLRENSDNVTNDLTMAISEELRKHSIDATKEERAAMNESLDMRNEATKVISFKGLTIVDKDLDSALGAISAAMQKQNEAYVQAREEALAVGDYAMVGSLDEKYVAAHSNCLSQINAAMQNMDINEQDFEVTKADIIMYLPEEIEAAERMADERVMEKAEEMTKEEAQKDKDHEEPEMVYEQPEMDTEEFEYDDEEPEIEDLFDS